jgi:hypothetical protein
VGGGVVGDDLMALTASLLARLWAMRWASEQYLGRRPVSGTVMGDWQKRHGVVVSFIVRKV